MIDDALDGVVYRITDDGYHIRDRGGGYRRDQQTVHAASLIDTYQMRLDEGVGHPITDEMIADKGEEYLKSEIRLCDGTVIDVSYFDVKTDVETDGGQSMDEPEYDTDTPLSAFAGRRVAVTGFRTSDYGLKAEVEIQPTDAPVLKQLEWSDVHYEWDSDAVVWTVDADTAALRMVINHFIDHGLDVHMDPEVKMHLGGDLNR